MKINQSSVFLESVSFPYARENFQQKLARKTARIFQNVIEYLAGNSEPKISQIPTRDGNSIWQIYDPKTGKTEEFIGEEDVRIWIEQQYYR